MHSILRDKNKATPRSVISKNSTLTKESIACENKGMTVRSRVKVYAGVEEDDSDSKEEMTKRPGDYDSMPDVTENCTSDEKSQDTSSIVRQGAGEL